MTFLAMIIALSLQQVLQPGNVLQRDAWLLRWDSTAARFTGGGWPRVLAVVLAATLAALVVLDLVEGWLFGLVELLFSAAFFVWSLGRDDFHTALERHAHAGKSGAPVEAAVDGLWVPMDSEFCEPDAPTTSQQSSQQTSQEAPSVVSVQESPMQARQRLLYAGYARWFAPLFYFAIGGPVAAVLYRLVAVLTRAGQERAYRPLLAALDWAPSRLLGLTFAVTGDFLAVSQCRPLALLKDATPAALLLERLAGAACGERADISALGKILYRSAGVWLLLLAVVLVLG